MKKLLTLFIAAVLTLSPALLLAGCADRERVEYIGAEAVEVWGYNIDGK